VPGRVKTRRQFARLAHPSKKGRSGPLRIHFVESSEPSEDFSAAYAIGKTVGNAVVRNTIRRRLRAVMDEVRGDAEPGLYLIKCGFGTNELDYDQLRDHVRHALRSAGTLR